MVGMSIASSLAEIQTEINEICLSCNRSAASVNLVAVSKTKPLSAVQEAFAAGQKIFGENYVQEALEKSAALPQAAWHLIGSLQTNKLKSIAGKFKLIHSIDRLRLASMLDKVSTEVSAVQDILLQIHVGDEETKSGVSFDEAPDVIRQILLMPGLRLRGLMALPPLTEDEKAGRAAFASVRQALEKWRNEFSLDPSVFCELSMGTSGDFAWAIQEGATLVRVGTSIFGARN